MIRSQDAIDQLAIRIERAYLRKHPRWSAIGLSPGVWASAASRLLEAPGANPTIPIDAELFVAVQIRNRLSPDPWAELTQRRSTNRYLSALRRIVGQLREELKSEVRRAECRLLRGMPLDLVLATEGSRISPLGCYILAYRAGRDDLSAKHRASAESQHRSCPLYRLASRHLLPGDAYPDADPEPKDPSLGHEIVAFSLN